MPPKLPIASIAFALAAATPMAPASADYEAAVQAYLAGDYFGACWDGAAWKVSACE